MQTKPFWFEAMSTDEASRWRKPWVAVGVLGMCAVLYGAQLLFPDMPIYAFFSFSLPTQWFEVYRLLTPIFLHFTILHIAFNTAIFWFFSRQIETLLGHWTLVWIILLSGLISNFGQYLVSGDRFGGLSGVVMAVIAFVWMGSRFGYKSRLFMPHGLMIFVLASLVLGFIGVLDVLVGPIAHVAHTLGFISGLFLWPVLNVLKSSTARK